MPGVEPQQYRQIGPMPANPNASPYDSMSMAQVADSMRPNFVSMADEMSATDPSYTGGLNAMRGFALAKGPTNYLSMSLMNEALKRADQREKMLAGNASKTASAKNSLAASGGLSSGARERVDEQGQRNYLSMMQDANRSADMADMGARVQDESTKMNAANNLTAAEGKRQEQWMNAKKTDYDNQLKVYQSQLEAIAAERQANATANAGKK